MSWYALYTKPHAERQVEAALQARRIETYLPTVEVWRARRRRVEEEPFFACYLFARLDLEQVGISAVAWLPGLRYIISSGETPTPVPAELVAYIRQRLAGLEVQPPLALKPGQAVRIVEGPLQDMEAVFEQHLSGYERAQVLVQVLGRLARYQLPSEWLARK